jgi:hypothetical protein
MAAFGDIRERAQRRTCPFAGEKLEAASGVEPLMEVLQTSALPLGYAASVDAPHDKEADDRAHGFCPLPRPREGDWSG